MVSKTKFTITTTTTKRTPTKSPKPTRLRPKLQQQQPPSPSSSLCRSLRSCRRRLLGILSLLSPSNRSRHRYGFRRLNPLPIQKQDHPTTPQLLLLLPLPSPSKPTLFLDLDETLIHSTPHSPPSTPYDFIVRPVIDGHVIPFYVSKRPGVDSLLEAAAESFEVVVFTAGLREYASLVLDRLDPEGRFVSHRLYRDSCREMGGKLVKDLSGIGRDLGKVVIFDDNPNCYSLQPENAVPVRPFLGDVSDREVERLMGFFEKALDFEDMRDAVKCYLKNDCE